MTFMSVFFVSCCCYGDDVVVDYLCVVSGAVFAVHGAVALASILHARLQLQSRRRSGGHGDNVAVDYFRVVSGAVPAEGRAAALPLAGLALERRRGDASGPRRKQE